MIWFWSEHLGQHRPVGAGAAGRVRLQTLSLTFAALRDRARWRRSSWPCARQPRKPRSGPWSATYVEVGAGTPALVILFVIYFGLPTVFPRSSSTASPRPRSGSGCRAARDRSARCSGRGSRRSTGAARGVADRSGSTPAQTMRYVIAAAGRPRGAAAGRQLRDRPAQGHLDRLDHRRARPDAARQGPGVVELHADAALRARGLALLRDELSAVARSCGRLERRLARAR